MEELPVVKVGPVGRGRTAQASVVRFEGVVTRGQLTSLLQSVNPPIPESYIVSAQQAIQDTITTIRRGAIVSVKTGEILPNNPQELKDEEKKALQLQGVFYTRRSQFNDSKTVEEVCVISPIIERLLQRTLTRGGGVSFGYIPEVQETIRRQLGSKGNSNFDAAKFEGVLKKMIEARQWTVTPTRDHPQLEAGTLVRIVLCEIARPSLSW